jgi:hypothetical protein
MFKRVGLIVGILLPSILLLGYVFRLSLLQWVIAPQLEKADITLSCLDFSITAKLNIHADKVCLNYQNQQLELIGITANTRKVIVENAILNITPFPNSNESSQSAKKLNLALPVDRPLINIKQLIVNSNALNESLKISVSEPTLNQFNVTGDINAKATLVDNKVSGQFAIDEALLKHIMNTENTAMAGVSFNTQQTFSFDGVEAKLHGDISAQFSHTYEQCQFKVLTSGKLATRFNLNSQALMLDTDLLNNKINLTASCTELIPPSEYASFVSDQIPLNWQIKLPKAIRLEGNELSIPAISLMSEGDKQFDILITDTALNIKLPLENLQANLSAQISTPNISTINFNAQLVRSGIKGDYAVVLESLPMFASATANGLNLSGNFAISEFVDSKPVGLISANLTLSNFDAFDINAVQYRGNLTAKMNNALNAEVTLTNQLKSAEYKEFKIRGISNTLAAKANLGVGELFAELTAQTHVKAINSPEIKLNDIKITSTGLQSRAFKASHHAFINGIELVVNHHISAQAHPFDVIIPEQNVAQLNPLVSQFEPLAQLTKGTLGGYASGDVNLQSAIFNININNISALYNDYLASDLNSTLSGKYNSGQLNVKPTTFTLNEFRAGAVIKNIKGHWQINNNSAQVNNINGNVFGGEFLLDTFALGKSNQVATIRFENVDASKLITLDDKSGIKLTGLLKGNLPVHYNGTDIEVIDGSLATQGTGKLEISNNAAFDSVMQQQQELKPILGLLTNLDIQKLSSTVALKSDGWLKLGVNLHGYNKQEQQQVNFNYNHEENIFTLLRALRLSDEITQKVEQQYSQKGN